MNAVKLKLRVDPTTGPALRSFALKTARVLQGEKVEFTAEDIAIQAWLLEQAREIDAAAAVVRSDPGLHDDRCAKYRLGGNK